MFNLKPSVKVIVDSVAISNIKRILKELDRKLRLVEASHKKNKNR